MYVKKHNITAYQKAREALAESRAACVVEPTGCGKSYVALQFYRDFEGRKILYLTSYKAILDYFGELLDEELGIGSFDGCIYPNLKGREFSGYDLIILDEFHRCGAARWQEEVKRVIADNPGAKVLGLSATPIRFLDDERDMSEELFHGNVAFSMTLPEAIEKEILPFPDYRVGVYSIRDDFEKLYNRYSSRKHKSDDTIRLLETAKRKLENGIGLPDLFQDTIREKTGHYIVFCPTIEKLREYKNQAPFWMKKVNWNLKTYEYHSKCEEADGIARFIADKSGALHLLFVCDALNEGVHIPDVDGVILMRPTESGNVFYQQIGRAISIGGSSRPQIIDIVGNLENLRGSVSFLSDLAAIRTRHPAKFRSVVFEVYSEHADLVATMKEVLRRMLPGWDEMYRAAKAYYEEFGNLMPSYDTIYKDYSLGHWIVTQRNFYRKGVLLQERMVALDKIGMVWDIQDHMFREKYALLKEYQEREGNICLPWNYKANGVNLYSWFIDLRRRYKQGTLTDEQIKMMEELGFSWDPEAHAWEEKIELLKKAKEIYGTINVPYSAEVDGKYPGRIVVSLRVSYKKGSLSKQQVRQLEDLGMDWDYAYTWQNRQWDECYRKLRAYYEAHGDLNISYKDKMHSWMTSLRQRKKRGGLSAEQIRLLDELHFDWNPTQGKAWDDYYEACRAYYEEHGNLSVPKRMGEYHGLRIGEWLVTQRARYNGTNKKYSPLAQEQIDKLTAIGMEWTKRPAMTWEEWFELYKEYIKETGSTMIVTSAKYKGCALGEWVSKQRKDNNAGRILPEHYARLSDAGMIWKQDARLTWDEAYKKAEEYYEKNGDLLVPTNFITPDGFTLGSWIIAQRQKYHHPTAKKNITPEQIERLEKIGMVWSARNRK